MRVMKKSFWLIYGILALFLSLIFDDFIVKLIAANRLILLDSVIGYFSRLTNGVFSFVIIGLVLFYYKREQIYRFIIGFGVVGAIAYLLKILIKRARPFDSLDIANLVPVDSAYSFPSGHAIFAFFCLGFIWKDFKRFRYFWLVITVLIALARLYTGVHYMSDLIASSLIGLILGSIFSRTNIFKSLRISK